MCEIGRHVKTSRGHDKDVALPSGTAAISQSETIDEGLTGPKVRSVITFRGKKTEQSRNHFPLIFRKVVNFQNSHK